MIYPRSLQWRIAAAYTLLMLAVLAAVGIYLAGQIRQAYLLNQEERLVEETALVTGMVAGFSDQQFDAATLDRIAGQIALIAEARVTIFNEQGNTLADNWHIPAITGDQSNQPEVQSAIATGLGKSTRLDTSSGIYMVYAAMPVKMDNGSTLILRIGAPLSEVQSKLNRITTFIVIAGISASLASVALAYIIARRLSRSVRSMVAGVRTYAGGNLDHRLQAGTDSDTRELADAFNNMATSLTGIIRDLSSESHRLSAVLDTMADGVVVIDSQGTVEIINRAAETMLGLKERPAAGLRFLEVFRDHELHQLVSRCLHSGQRQHAEVELLRYRRYLSATATPLVQDRSIGALLTLHDLTRVRQVETTRREFVSNVSHELRSPLAAIKAMVETLEDGALEDSRVAKDFLGGIHRDIDRMSEIVNDLLELSRLESGSESLKLAPVDLRDVFDEAKAQLAAFSGSALIQASFIEGMFFVMGDKSKLERVLFNLLHNAVKFTPSQGEITVSARTEGEMVEVSVNDTGIGIPEEHIPHVFERFYKVDRSRSDEGSGLGLAIVKHIVQAHGGEVKIESREGVGSTFFFTVPIAHPA